MRTETCTVGTTSKFQEEVEECCKVFQRCFLATCPLTPCQVWPIFPSSSLLHIFTTILSAYIPQIYICLHKIPTMCQVWLLFSSSTCNLFVSIYPPLQCKVLYTILHPIQSIHFLQYHFYHHGAQICSMQSLPNCRIFRASISLFRTHLLPSIHCSCYSSVPGSAS